MQVLIGRHVGSVQVTMMESKGMILQTQQVIRQISVNTLVEFKATGLSLTYLDDMTETAVPSVLIVQMCTQAQKGEHCNFDKSKLLQLFKTCKMDIIEQWLDNIVFGRLQENVKSERSLLRFLAFQKEIKGNGQGDSHQGILVIYTPSS